MTYHPVLRLCRDWLAQRSSLTRRVLMGLAWGVTMTPVLMLNTSLSIALVAGLVAGLMFGLVMHGIDRRDVRAGRSHRGSGFPWWLRRQPPPVGALVDAGFMALLLVSEMSEGPWRRQFILSVIVVVMMGYFSYNARSKAWNGRWE